MKGERSCGRKRKEMAGLSCDLMIDILSRLPVKTLFKFRCVCKLWLQLISDPHLLHLHSHRSKHNPLLCFSSLQYSNPKTGSSSTLHLSCMDMEGKVIHKFEKKVEGHIKMLPSRFELVCLYGALSIYVCNPTTTEFITLPQSPPSNSKTISVGFGYIPSTKEYKVVRIFSRWERVRFRRGCEVLTLGSSSWRNVMDPPFGVCASRPAFVDGSLHWTIDLKIYYTILAFDIETEEFRVFPYPESFREARKINEYEMADAPMSLVELGGLLCLAVAIEGKMDIWMLKDYKNHVWVKEYSINMNTIDPHNYVKTWKFTARDIWDEKILIESYEVGFDYYNLQSEIDFYYLQSKIDYYDLQRKSFKRFELEEEMIRRPQFCFYVESFCSLGSMVEKKKVQF